MSTQEMTQTVLGDATVAELAEAVRARRRAVREGTS
jgi:hypothetical protein